MQYPINYDFKANWDTKIKPFLDDPRIKKAIREGIMQYCRSFKYIRKYKNNTVPAIYSSSDYYVRLTDRRDEIKFEELRRSGLLPKRYLLLEEMENKLRAGIYNNAESFDDYEEDFSKIYNEQDYIKIKLLESYFTFDKVKYDIESYVVQGACHSWAPTFQLTLAKLVEPNEKWKVRSSDKHSTVINEDGTKIFDLLFWAYTGRLENHMFGDPLSQEALDDYTLGGKNAYIDSTDPDDLKNIMNWSMEKRIDRLIQEYDKICFRLYTKKQNYLPMVNKIMIVTKN
jgi:hypothetical protein